MSDLIDRQKAIDEINKLEYPSSLVDVKRIIVELPSAQPERKTGKWKNSSPVTVRCSECNCVVADYHASDYCPNCGADMRGKQDEINRC